ncbi:tyrosine-type recombinase/integrase, partial [Celeribacter sp.]|uniref:tyrosine-type recombinase/integrase n=1 Tax=Celeribacter sp. TaxID=1890673 RepID=UPI003A940786
MLTDTQARNLKPHDKAVAVGGVAGLTLKPSSRVGTGKYTLRFVSPCTGKRRDMGLGSYPETGLAKARKLALEARELIASGLDPIDQRDAEKQRVAARRGTPTFAEAARHVFEDIGPAFRNEKHRKQWITTLTTYAFPIIGHTRVDQLTTADFARCLKPIWLAKPETASRVKQRCDRVMTWCVAHG